jgi:uncharacterized protein (TIGR01777 family)
MRVLVTGATGFLGSAVSAALLARRHDVVGLTRDPDRARRRDAKVSWHGWSPADERPPPEALDGVDGVVNLVGEPLDQRWTPEAKQRIRDSRVRATKNLVDAIGAADPRPGVLVSQSAVGYYGDRGKALVEESTGPGSAFDSEVCVAWEAAARAAEQSGVRVAVIRTGLVLDPGHGLLKQLLLPFKLGIGGPLAGGDQYMPWIHVDDEVRLLLWALEKDGAAGAYNAAAPHSVTNREFSRALGRVLRRPAVVPIPELALRLRFGGELAEVAQGGQRAAPRRAVDEGFEFRHPELEPALRDLLGR